MNASGLADRLLGLSRRRKQAFVVTCDLSLAEATLWLTLSLRYEGWFIPWVPQQWALFIISPLIAFPVFVRCGLYRAIFRYSGFGATAAIARAVGIYTALFGISVLLLAYLVNGVPRTVAVIQPFLFSWAVLGTRMVGGWLLSGAGLGLTRSARERVLVFGAGVTGIQTVGALQVSGRYHVIGFIDDSPAKVGRQILGVDVISRARAETLLRREEVDSVVLALADTSRADRNGILEWLRGYAVHVRTIPSVIDLATGRVTLADMRELDIEDLLGRDPLPLSIDRVAGDITGKVVMVTGAGGSIGSELCRQLLKARPSTLVMIESSEFALYAIHNEIAETLAVQAPATNLTPLICDVRNRDLVRQAVDLWRPAVIYHAAAYKHVPLVEHNVVEGLSNNTLGTINVAQAAIEFEARRFVLISTDKAVRPTNVMGASKRLAELALQAMAAETELALENGLVAANRTVLTMVRFGNVLGSSGSVVPLFRAQLRSGGPLTVTHEDVTRYFMTIPEAAQLVLEAGARAEGGEVFLLDMGEPVRIMDLARKIIELSGSTVRDDQNPGGDIAIEVTGLRPGEKLYEELLIDDAAIPTDHPRIMMAREPTWSWAQFNRCLPPFREALNQNDVTVLRSILSHLVDGYDDAGAIVDHIAVQRTRSELKN